MRSQSSAKRNSRTRVVGVPWEVVSVKALPDWKLLVAFADGTKGEVELRPYLFDRDPGVFEPLRDRARFEEVFVDREAGCVSWPGQLDLAPDAMYDDIRASGGESRRSQVSRASIDSGLEAMLA